MKIIRLRRRASPRSGREAVGTEGMVLADREGRRDCDTCVIGYSESLADEQTARFYAGAMIQKFRWLETLHGLGNKDLLAEIDTQEFREVSESNSAIDSLLTIHGLEKVQVWSETSLGSLIQIFGDIRENETATCFVHQISILLVQFGLHGYNVLNLIEADPDGFTKNLKDLEGHSFFQSHGAIRMLGKLICQSLNN